MIISIQKYGLFSKIRELLQSQADGQEDSVGAQRMMENSAHMFKWHSTL